MKTTKQAKKTRAVVNPNPEPALAGATSFWPTKSLEDITNEFLAKQKQGKKSNGDNDDSHISDFSLAVKMLCHSYQHQSFNFNDVLALTRHLDTPSSALVPLWHDYVNTMKENRRIKVINIIGIPQYTFC